MASSPPNITLSHPTLKTTLTGVQSTVDEVETGQFRGIKYGHVPGRFKAAQIYTLNEGEGGSTEFGPVCPQNYISPSIMLRIPEQLEDKLETQDEFECLNLTVTIPLGQRRKIPILIWIHGGSQTVTFGSAAGKLCDPRKIVSDSVRAGRPLIVVALNYRLNIFGFGNGTETNLALKDQILGIHWVREHIEGFGGDRDRITLAGESAGAVYVHAHTIIGSPINRAILMSGSLNLSTALPLSRGKAMIDGLAGRMRQSDGCELADAPVETLLRHLRESGIVSVWLQAADGLEGWEEKQEAVQAIMVGDCEYESILWRNGVEAMTTEQINACFDKASNAAALKKAYGVVPSRSTATTLGALDFLNDLRFAIPSCDISKRWRSGRKPVYQYLVDQPNPWQTSNRAHHAVDLIFLFGGYDLSLVSPAAAAAGREMRARFTSFINGEAPWNTEKIFAFGPYGESKEIEDMEYAARRRVRHFDVIKKSHSDEIASVFVGLHAGNLSLYN